MALSGPISVDARLLTISTSIMAEMETMAANSLR
jgi:hypothetical protein